MTLYQAKQLLVTAAFLYRHEKESFSKTEIVKKINEIKYLSAQKKIPKMSLRKEIVHLEGQLQGVYQLEKKLLLRKRRESAEVSTLKKRISSLQRKIETTQDHDLQKKVEKLSHLLGDYLAKAGSQEEILQVQKILAETKTPQTVPLARMVGLQKRLQLLKEKILQNPAQAQQLQTRITLLEQKLSGYGITSEPEEVKVAVEEPAGEASEIKHRMIFDQPLTEEEEENLQKELPLPPPPRIVK